MPDLVISNTSPLFYLHQLGHLDLLQKLYERIVVPEAVVAELEAGRDQGEDVPDVTDYDWIEVRSIHVPKLLKKDERNKKVLWASRSIIAEH